MNTIPAPTSSRLPAALILTALLLLLAFRLTASETLRDSITQKAQTIAAQANPSPDNPGAVPIIGPAYTAAYSTITLFLSAAACFIAGKAQALTRRRLAQLALIAMILALLLASTFHAATRFHALIGAADIAASLLAAWTVTVLCHEDLLGLRARHAIIAAIVAILALGTAKALMQHFIEFPDLAQYMKEHKDEVLRAQGIVNDPVQEALFLSRINSGEVNGFGSLSNVFATEMSALIALLTALLVAAIPLLKQNPRSPPSSTARAVSPATRFRAAENQPSSVEIPIAVVAYIAIAILLVLALTAIFFSGSKGGIAAAILAAIVLALGGFFRDRVFAWRKPLLTLAALAVIALPAAVISYGITHHGLPSKSLLFRWQYWVGSVPMIQHHPLWGVGLNNFGDYYLQFKLPSSPEDVKDPHSFFIRLAAEAGLPAALALAMLLGWFVIGALRHRPAALPQIENQKSKIENNSAIPGLTRTLVLAAAAASAWIPLHFLAETPNEFTIMLTIIFAAIAWAIFTAALYLLDALPPNTFRYLPLAAAIAALAMLLYDQINMALVTGPAATLFWILLILGDCHDGRRPREPQSKIENRKSKITAAAISLPLAAAGLATLFILTMPLANGTFPWDPAPWEYAYIGYLNAGRYDLALKALDGALTLAPNSGELIMQRIHVNRLLHRPTAADIQRILFLDAALARSPNSGKLLIQLFLVNRELHRSIVADIRKMLSLDRANAKIRLDLALPDSDLPVAERIAALQQALVLDQQLPADELKRLKPEQIQSVKDTLDRLQPLETAPHPP